MLNLTGPETMGDESIDIDSTGLAINLIDFEWVVDNIEPPFCYMGPFEGGQISEDAYFCLMMKRAGGKIVGDCGVRAGHLGGPIIINDDNEQYLREKSMGVHNIVEAGIMPASNTTMENNNGSGN